MNPAFPQDDAEPDQSISALVNEFFDRRQAGEDLTPERFAAEHPEVAEALRPYLAGLGLADKVCTSKGDTGAQESITPAGRLPAPAGYELIEEIGRGGMGVVYKALQISTKRIVALKVMLAGPFASATARRRFDREVELAARLQHPGIVRVLESGEVAEQRYYAMDYVAGARLDRYLSAAEPDPRTMLQKLFIPVCEAVEYAHRHNVIHRDLKPGNVLIDDEGSPHILDFGLAKAADQADADEGPSTCVSLTGQVLGTLFYLSPEQAAGIPEEVDARTDVYALGVMLFEALTGALPFDTVGRPSQVIQRILESAPSRPSTLSEHVDGELETIILKALEKDKSHRYQSAREMADDIARYLAGEPILARRPSSLYVLRKKLRKHRAGAALATVAVALIAIGLVAGIWWRRHDLDVARRTALRCQKDLELGSPSAGLVGPAEALYERHPQLPETALVWAQVQFSREDMRRRAIGFLEGQLRRGPSAWACGALLADICRVTTGHAERADALHEQAERDAPDTAEAWYIRSFATLDLGRARQYAQQAAERDPSHKLAWQRLTHLCLRTGDLDGALAGADRLIELGEDPADWVFFKGQALAAQGRFRKAIEQYTWVIERDSEGSEKLYRYRAHAYRRVKEYEKAVADYTKAFEVAGDQRPYQCLYQRATPLWILGRPEEALDDYRRVRVMLGRAFYSDARQYIILCELSRTGEAEQVLDAALRDVEDHWLRQIFRCLAGQLTPAELVANGASRNNREQLCEAYYYAGEACLLAGRATEARGWFEQCVRTGIEFDPDTSPAVPMNEFELAQWRLESLVDPEITSPTPASLPSSRP